MNEDTKYLKDYTMVHNLIIRTNKLDVYQKCCINNILSNTDDFRIALSILAQRIPCSRDKCIKTINSLKELNIVSVNKARTPNGDWDSNLYKVELINLFEYIGVVVEKDNVVFNKDYLVVEKDNGSISQIPQVVSEKDNKNTNKNTNIENNIYKKEKDTNLDKIINSYSDDEELKDTICDFLKMRKSIKRPMTDRALKIMLKKLNGFSDNAETQIKILEQSIVNSWQGIFQLKEDRALKQEKKLTDMF